MAAGGKGMKYSKGQKSSRHSRKDRIMAEKKMKKNQKKYRKAMKDESVKKRFKKREKIPDSWVGKKDVVEAAYARKLARDAAREAGDEVVASSSSSYSQEEIAEE